MNGERKIWTSLVSAQKEGPNSILVPNSCNHISIKKPILGIVVISHYGTLWITLWDTVDSTPYFDNNDDDIDDVSFSVEFPCLYDL